MGTATAATTGFEREADKLLRAAGYEPERRSGNNHLMYRHRFNGSIPHIRVPSTPKNASESLVHIGHAIRRGSATMVPQGKETDMAPKETAAPGKRLSEKLVALASPHMVKVAAEKKRKHDKGDKTRRDPDQQYNVDCGKWVRRCIETHGAIHSSHFAEAATELWLSPAEMSTARTYAGATAFKRAGAAKDQVYTDFVGRIPKDAVTWGGRNIKGRDMGPGRKVKGRDVKTSWQEPTAPAATPANGNGAAAPETNGNEGRRLEQGGLTPEQHADAERRMVDAHRTAEAERQAILAERGESVDTVRGESNGNGNGKPKSQLDAAMELLREAALADTHALTKEDIQALLGMAEMHRRQAQEHTAAAGMIRRLLERVAPGAAMEVAA